MRHDKRLCMDAEKEGQNYLSEEIVFSRLFSNKLDGFVAVSAANSSCIVAELFLTSLVGKKELPKIPASVIFSNELKTCHRLMGE